MITVSDSVDDERWVEQALSYRVDFWRRPVAGAQEPSLWMVSPRRLTNVRDVEEVFDWARRHAEGRQFAVYVEVDRGKNRGLIRLYGVDPTET